MKALRYHGRADVRVEDLPTPDPADGEILVRIATTGICGSDIHEYRGGPLAIPLDTPHPLTGDRAPVTMGHEFSGTIVALGSGATGLRVGQRVAASAVLRCGTCPSCTAGHPQLCRTLGFHGISGGGGAFAEFDAFPAYLANPLPDEISDEAGALLEPLATGIHAVGRSGLTPGQSALVVGAGPIGLMVVVAALAAGADQIIVSEPSPVRAKAAARFGATAVLDPKADDVVARVRELTGGHGVDAAFDTAAAPTSFDTALAAVRPRGHVVNVAVWENPTPLQPNALLFSEATITGSLAYTPAEFTRAVEIAAGGAHDLESMVTRSIALADVVTHGFERLAADPGADIKVLVRP
ncbi:2,3-butanediol dehydrogenase [Amycolatopsis rhabdoformis]|uniref:2,3-butanediol dehydrogenase n=1 Tax=Amycolatopsis rhabdoformis TaxID=1448059 RepID=A0ABZ1IDH8_9PSEU|nr:2,3-butanediol dehydrogenase [Amycolatopsis rhabdoformis]WSE32495.1 2,3-butanediol dehydrogenase [Amycolatopsis rhabdoformis]